MKKIVLFIFIMTCGGALAQKIETIKVSAERGIPGESFSKTSFGIEFWIQEPQLVIAVDPTDSKVLALRSSGGESLFDGHQKAVAARKKHVEEQAKKGRYMFSSRSEDLVDYSRSVALRDTLGFKFVIDSWSLPPKGASSINCKFDIAYYVLDASAEASTYIVENVVLGKASTITINGRDVAIKQNGSSTSNGRQKFFFQMSTLDIGALVEKVELVNEANELLEDLTGYRPTELTSFRIDQDKVNTAVRLRFTFKPLFKKKILLEKQVALGI